MLVVLANTFAYRLFLLIIMPLSCLKLIYGPPRSLAIVVLNITLSFLTIILIFCGFTLYEKNPMSSLTSYIFTNMFKLNSNAKLNHSNVIVADNLTIINVTLYLIKMAYNFVSHAPAPPNKTASPNG